MAAETYQNLIHKEWSTQWEGTANEDGVCELNAFYGTYIVKVGDDERKFEFTKQDGWKCVDFVNQ
ncbi:MAG: hypothetical protein WDZ47_10930 [Bacteroidales bacterium]